MNQFKRRITLRVLGIHAAVVVVLMLQSLLHGCFRPEPKPEIVTFIDFGEPMPTPVIEEVTEISRPEPQPAPTPDPTPVPEPPKPTPKPTPVPKPQPKPVPTPEPKPEPKAEPKKSDWSPASVDEIKKGKRINDTPPKPVISADEIRKELSDISKPVTKSGNANEISAYDAHIHSVFYNAWDQPAIAASRPARITISITSTGRIKSWRLSQSSGDPEFDATVERAVKSISILPQKPPAGYPLNDIVINFNIN